MMQHINPRQLLPHWLNNFITSTDPVNRVIKIAISVLALMAVTTAIALKFLPFKFAIIPAIAIATISIIILIVKQYKKSINKEKDHSIQEKRAICDTKQKGSVPKQEFPQIVETIEGNVAIVKLADFNKITREYCEHGHIGLLKGWFKSFEIKHKRKMAFALNDPLLWIVLQQNALSPEILKLLMQHVHKLTDKYNNILTICCSAFGDHLLPIAKAILEEAKERKVINELLPVDNRKSILNNEVIQRQPNKEKLIALINSYRH